MVNTIGGKNYKKGKKGGRKSKNPDTEFNTENGLHFYGQVLGRLGGNTLQVMLQTGETVHASIPGRFMKRVWFNKDDLIVVSNETDKIYDVVQKITNPATQLIASTALNIKLDKDNSNFFRADIDDIQDESDEEEEKNDSKASLALLRKKNDKERDIKRRQEETDEFDRVISVVKDGDDDSSSSDDEDEKSQKSGSTQSTKSTQSTQSTQSTDSSDSSDSEDDEVLPKTPVRSTDRSSPPNVKQQRKDMQADFKKRK